MTLTKVAISTVEIFKGVDFNYLWCRKIQATFFRNWQYSILI